MMKLLLISAVLLFSVLNKVLACPCSDGYKCFSGECWPISCKAETACQPGYYCMEAFGENAVCDSKVEAERIECEQSFSCINPCAFTKCASNYFCRVTNNGAVCDPSNCNAVTACDSGLTCVEEEASNSFKCLNSCNDDGICNDPHNYACNENNNLCEPIDCGAKDACKANEVCYSMDKICSNVPCPQYSCEINLTYVS